jgi:hypothetical protein
MTNTTLFFIIHITIIFRMWNIPAKLLENTKTKILNSVPFFENRAVYKIMLKILQTRTGYSLHDTGALH